MTTLVKSVLSAAMLFGVIGSVAHGDTPSGSEPPVAQSSSTNASRRSLDRPLPELRFNATPLSDVLDFLSDATSSNFAVDWKELDAAHIAKDTPITLRMSSSLPLHKVLNIVLDQAAGRGVLTYFVDEGVIEITSEEASDKVLISRTYPIQDLLFQPTDYTNAPDLSLQSDSQGQSAGGGGGGGGSNSQSLFNNANTSSTTSTAGSQADRAQEIIKLITDTVKPELWQVNGGTATISFFRGNLIVNAPRSIHELLESQ